MIGDFIVVLILVVDPTLQRNIVEYIGKYQNTAFACP